MDAESKAAQRELVAMCYGDCQTPPRAARCLNFKTEMLGVREACELLDVIGGYNRFEPDSVREALKPFESDERVYVQVGRESSPVLYILAGDDKKRAAIKKALKKALPDELSDEYSTIRAWWD